MCSGQSGSVYTGEPADTSPLNVTVNYNGTRVIEIEDVATLAAEGVMTLC